MIKDRIFELQIKNNHMAVLNTDKIVGKILLIHIDASAPINVLITDLENQMFLILKLQNIYGKNVYNPRTRVVDSEGNIFNYQVTEYVCNEKLLLRITGGMGATCKIKIRTDES